MTEIDRKSPKNFPILVLLATVFYWFTPGSLMAQKFHAIIVADLSPASGWGELGSDAIIKDAFGMLFAIENNVPYAQLTSNFLLLYDDDESHPKEIVSALEESTPGPNDVLFFYFSGHGALDDDGQFLKLASGKLYRKEIMELMAAKGARFNVLITDCCNMRLDGKKTSFPYMASVEPRVVSPLFQSLFFSQRGWVDINSSRPGEASFIQINNVPESQRNSIFTGALTGFFHDNFRQSASWDRLVREVSLDVATTFHRNFPKGASIAKGLDLQLEQNVYAITYPGMPESSGPRSGIGVRDHTGEGVYVTTVTPGMPATRCVDVRTRKYETIKVGQVVTQVNNQAVRDSVHFAELVKNSPQIMRLTIKENNATREFLIRLQY